MLYFLVEYRAFDGRHDKLPALTYGGYGDYESVTYTTWMPDNRKVIAQVCDQKEKLFELRRDYASKNPTWHYRIEVESGDDVVMNPQ